MIVLGHKILGIGTKKVIFLHELMGNYQNYEPIFPYLDTEKFTFIFVDLRGYGLSKDVQASFMSALNGIFCEVKEVINICL